MASKPLNCSCCGKKILNGLSYTHNGKGFCYECYKNLKAQLLASEDEQQLLYQYIKKLFSVNDIPQDIINGISREVEKGKKYKGARLTLHYYYEILERPRAAIESVPFIIRDYYDRAKAYEIQVAATKKINEGVDLTHTPTRVIHIDRSTFNRPSTRRKPKYDISDL